MTSKRRGVPALRSRYAWVISLPLALVAASAAESCSGTSPPEGVAEGCVVDSDCDKSLVCKFGLCHAECDTSKDCSGATCLPPGVCELSQESTCSATLPCVTGLTCADAKCRAPCIPGAADACLKGQSCIAVANSSDHVCVDDMPDGGRPDAGATACSATLPCVKGLTCVDSVCRAVPDAGRSDGEPSDAKREGASDATVRDAKDDSRGDDEASSDDASDSSAPAETGCTVPEAGPGPLGFMPSNFDPLALLDPDGGLIPLDAGPDGGGVDWSSAPDVVISGPCGGVSVGLGTCLGVSPVAILIAHSSPLCEPGCYAELYVLNSLTIESGGSLTAFGEPGYTSYPAILAVRTTVAIQGTFSMAASNFGGGVGENAPGYGGYPGPNNMLGPGAGGTGEIAQYPNSDPGGGAFCGAGGRGGFTSGTQTPGGAPYGSPKIVPLLAGSAGGYTNGVGQGAPGASGGGLQISAGGSITVANIGVINANGGASVAGGGAGGAILLEAPVVTIDGIVVANGGGGSSYNGYFGGIVGIGQPGQLNALPALGVFDAGYGGAGSMVNGTNGTAFDAGDASVYLSGGGGGAGWIRINTACGPVITGKSGYTVVSPSLDSGCASTGTLAY